MWQIIYGLFIDIFSRDFAWHEKKFCMHIERFNIRFSSFFSHNPKLKAKYLFSIDFYFEELEVKIR